MSHPKANASSQYALYRGDELVAIGTARELAEIMGVKPETVQWYTYPSAQRRCENRVRGKGILVERIS